MADDATVTLDTSNETTEEVVNSQIEETSAQEETEDLETLQEKNKRLFERAKKAEAEAKLLKAERLKVEEQAKRAEPEFSVSLKDQMALINAKVHEDDIEEVMDYAKYKGIPISEALKSSVVQATLRDKAEQRKTAEVTNTSGSKRITQKVTGDALLENAREGKFPNSDADISKLAEAFVQNLKKK